MLLAKKLLSLLKNNGKDARYVRANVRISFVYVGAHVFHLCKKTPQQQRVDTHP